HGTIDEMTRQTSPVGDAQRMATLNALVSEKNDEIDALEDELELVRSGSRAVREQLELAEAERNKAFKDNARLDSELRDLQRKYAVLEKAMMTVAPKSVTANKNPAAFDLVVQLLEIAVKGKTDAGRRKLHNSKPWDAVVRGGFDDATYKRLGDIVYGGSVEENEAKLVALKKPVTRKAVTKKIA
ncbi:hypothetical protein AB4Z34_36345, partial [Ensifer sp. 2YAB10]|uniref:hypothetical protein n=1 Tax=Ensifer sp. 2YAB10 TaxID=3233021 RepID=UPI003F901D18